MKVSRLVLALAACACAARDCLFVGSNLPDARFDKRLGLLSSRSEAISESGARNKLGAQACNNGPADYLDAVVFFPLSSSFTMLKCSSRVGSVLDANDFTSGSVPDFASCWNSRTSCWWSFS